MTDVPLQQLHSSFTVWSQVGLWLSPYRGDVDDKGAFKPRRWPLVIFVVVVTALLLAGCITTFFSVGLPLLTEIIE